MRGFSLVILVIVNTMALHVGAQDSEAVVRQFVNNPGLEGNFVYGYESSNGIRVEARGKPGQSGGQAIAGRFSWTTSIDGQPYRYAIEYSADQNGYQPMGAHLPTPPPIPLAILRSIDYNDRHPQEDESQRFGSNS